MKKTFFILTFMLATIFSANSQSIRLEEDRLFFNADVKYLCDDNDEVYGTFTIENNKKTYTVPYTIHQKGKRVMTYIEVIYDDEYNYPVSMLFSPEKSDVMSNKERFEIVSKLTFAMETIYRNILMEAEYDCK